MSEQQRGSVTQYRGEDYCHRCNGEGEINDWIPCAACLGTGRTFHEHVFNLTDVRERTLPLWRLGYGWCPVTPALPREERAAQAVAIVRAEVASYDAVTSPERGAPESLSSADSDLPEQIIARLRLAGLLADPDALDAAEAENEQHALANGGCVPADTYRDLAEHVAALRGRIEALADEWAQRVATVEHSAALRALAADEGERTGR